MVQVLHLRVATDVLPHETPSIAGDVEGAHQARCWLEWATRSTWGSRRVQAGFLFKQHCHLDWCSALSQSVTTKHQINWNPLGRPPEAPAPHNLPRAGSPGCRSLPAVRPGSHPAPAGAIPADVSCLSRAYSAANRVSAWVTISLWCRFCISGSRRKFKPQPMHQLHVIRAQRRSMGPNVERLRLAIGRNHVKRNLPLRLRQRLPRLAHAISLLVRAHLARKP